MALGLPIRQRAARPGSRAARMAELEDLNEQMGRELASLQKRYAAMENVGKRFDRLESMLGVLEDRLDAIENPKQLRAVS